MTAMAFELENISKTYSYFRLHEVSLALEEGQIMGFVGPNGAGKSTTIRILMGLIQSETGSATVLGHAMPAQQALAKRDIGFMTSDMALFVQQTLAWHMDFMRSIYSTWDADYARTLCDRFALHPQQQVKSFSQGERTKALLLLVLARRPRLLVLDEPTNGLDPVARHEVLRELMEILSDDSRSILFSSHNTVDVEQISDVLAFIDRGRIIRSDDKETFLNGWRRLKVDLPHESVVEALRNLPAMVEISHAGRVATLATNEWSEELQQQCRETGAIIQEVQRMTLEEVFVATVMRSRGEKQ